MNACVLIRTFPSKTMKIIEAVENVKGVLKTFPVYGRYDIVAFIEALDFEAVSEISRKINAIEGIKSTETIIEG